MASQNDVLEALNTKEAATSTDNLAAELKASKEGTRKQLTRLKDKGFVEGDSQEGWLVTEAGKKELEKGGVHPSMVEEGITPRDQFEAIGRRIGIPQDRIVLTADIVWSSDYTDIKWVWEALKQAVIRDDLARLWVNSWRAQLHKPIPLELEKELVGPEEKHGVKPGAGPRIEEGRSYILVDDLPAYVGKNLGDLTYEDALDLARIRGGRAARPQGAPSQQWGPDEILKIVRAVQEFVPSGAAAPKSYMVTQGEEGAIVQEVESGKPMVLQQPARQPGATYIVDNATGEVKELQSGQPIVVKQNQPQQPKVYVVQQDGNVQEQQLGQPIIVKIESSPNPSNLPALGFDRDGNPLFRNFDELINWKRFESEEKRADDQHKGMMEMVQLAKENVPPGIQAFTRAVSEQGKGASESEKSSQPQQQAYQCSNCKTKFTLPQGPWEFVACPSCGNQYSREDVFGSQEGA